MQFAKLETMSELGDGVFTEIDHLALHLTTSASRFSRVAGRVSGVTYSVTAWRTLAALDTKGPQRVTDLAVFERITQPSMTGLLQRLEEDGYVARAADPADRRATLVRLTAGGATALGAYRRASAARIRPVIAELSRHDRAVLAQAAQLLAEITEDPALS